MLYALIFIAKLNEKSSRIDLAASIRAVSEKLIRRHPHVFGNKKISSTDDVVTNWEAVKKAEGKKSPIDNIPPTLPALSRAQKVIHKLRAPMRFPQEKSSHTLGQRLWDLVAEGRHPLTRRRERAPPSYNRV